MILVIIDISLMKPSWDLRNIKILFFNVQYVTTDSIFFLDLVTLTDPLCTSLKHILCLNNGNSNLLAIDRLSTLLSTECSKGGMFMFIRLKLTCLPIRTGLEYTVQVVLIDL